VADVSVVVRTLNEERHLPALLDGIAAQTEKDCEVIVVDSGSTDGTRAIAEKRGAKLVHIAPKDFSFGRSLNRGIEAAQGRFIVVVSAHTRPAHERWLENLLRDLRSRPEVAMTYGRQVAWETSKFSEALDFDRFFGETPRVIVDHFFANNANSALRRETWQKFPFDESLPGLEDIDWARRVRAAAMTVTYAHDAPIHHIHEETWEQVRRRYHREGVAARRIGWLRRRDLPREIWGEFKWLCGDVAEARRRGVWETKRGEILRFRWNKIAGTIGGVWCGARAENS
jgi:glycosyltransferase involved in cell wall biosynthesis